ncbi:hypothetical protein HY345_01550 [Candidatus Microgenomates bacterium]|nr:hypothetical protein [Candidatus Microgenomates bacterium]
MSQNSDHQFKQISLKFFLSLGLILFLLIVTSLTYQAVFQNQDLRKKASESISQLPTKYKQPILLVNLNIDRNNLSLKVNSLQKGVGFVPDYNNPLALDYLRVDINDGITNQKFLIPVPVREVYAPPRNPDDHLNYPPRELDHFNYTVILPFIDKAQITFKKDFDRAEDTLQLQLSDLQNKKGMILQNDESQEINITELSPKYFGLSDTTYLLETIYDGDPTIADPAKTLDIVFVASGFNESNFDLFRSFTTKQADGLFGFANYPGKSPFRDNRRFVKIRRLVSPDTFHTTTNGVTHVDIDKVIQTLSSLSIPYDQFSVVLNADGRSRSTLGGEYNILFRTWGGSEERLLLFTHEFTHSFSAALDEYIERNGLTADLYDRGRNCKIDPTEKWLENTSGGSYLGCAGVWNLYRPELNSLMLELGENLEFNEPTKNLINQAFSPYTKIGEYLFIWPSSIFNFNDLASPISYMRNYSISIKNLGKSSALTTVNFSPKVNWIKNLKKPSTLPGDIEFDIDFPLLTTRGLYETSLVIETNSNPSIKKQIPIKIPVGNNQDTVSVKINNLQNGQIVDAGNSLSVPVEYSAQTPGIKRVNFYAYEPWQNPYNYNIFSSRTVAPFTATFNTVAENGYVRKGTYTLLTEAFPYLGSSAKSSSIDIQVKAPTGTLCANQPYHQCTNNRTLRECFLGAQDCGSNYCCPTNITPPPSPTVTPTSTSTPSPTPGPKPFFTTTSLPNGNVNKPYSVVIAASENDSKVKLTMTFKNRPAWLKKGTCKSIVKASKVTIRCPLSGTPTKKGKYDFSATVSDNKGATATMPYQIVIKK